MKVVLSTPPGRTTERWPPLGLLYIASSVHAQRSDKVRVIDAFCENLTKEGLVERVVRERPDVFGINCSTHTFLGAMDALQEIHKVLPETVLVMGGIQATFTAEQILETYPFVDYIIKGEAERAFPQLLECLEEGKTPSAVEGISFLQDRRLISQPLAVVKDLDSLPFPARGLVEGVEYGYSHQGIRLTFGKFTTLCSSRGCPFACTYCSCAAFSQRRWRARSPENVVDEIEFLQDEGYECAVFVDDNFTIKRSRVEEVCRLLRARKIRMRFYCEGRVDRAPVELLRTMKHTGFDVIYFGVESVSDHVLRYYKKGISALQSRNAIENAKRAGMLVVTSYIMGAPVESEEDILKTIDFIRATRPHAVQVNILDCLPGTEIWDEMARSGVVGPEDWKKNHRIWEYHENGLSRARLEELAEEGYAAHVGAWKNREGVLDFLRLMRSNLTGQKVVLGNILRVSRLRQISAESRMKAGQPNATERSQPQHVADADRDWNMG